MMVIQPKVRGFICTTAHPVGCQAEVAAQINYVKSQQPLTGPKNVLIIGASTGYGLASRIVATFGAGAKTIGVFYERPSDGKRTATAGWYNSAAFETMCLEENFYAKSINGDAFSDEIKQQTIDLIRQDFQKVDLIIYSLASPRRTHPDTQEVYNSALKPIAAEFKGKTLDPFKQEVKEVVLTPASEEEIANTVQVMGGDDWERWLNQLDDAGVLAEGVITLAYSYIGPELTHAIYKDGTIGKAKEHLQQTANKLNQKLSRLKGGAYISINKALVTQASAAIPVVPLYISLLFKLMKQKGTHEGCIEQIYRLFKDFLYQPQVKVDQDRLVRIDDLEMQADVQAKISSLWGQVNSKNLAELTDINGYCDDFYKLFGFKNAQVAYEEEVNPEVNIPSIMD